VDDCDDEPTLAEMVGNIVWSINGGHKIIKVGVSSCERPPTRDRAHANIQHPCMPAPEPRSPQLCAPHHTPVVPPCTQSTTPLKTGPVPRNKPISPTLTIMSIAFEDKDTDMVMPTPDEFRANLNKMQWTRSKLSVA